MTTPSAAPDRPRRRARAGPPSPSAAPPPRRTLTVIALAALTRAPRHTIAAVVLAALALAAASPPVAAAWRRPVPGAVSRAFTYSRASPFARGGHRGADFAARPGAAVRAACTGVVAFAGREDVTLRCGPWRVTHLPLATLAVRAGEHVHEGALLGTLAASRAHDGLHLGVRRAGDRFAYVDPVPFLPATNTPPAPAAPRGPRTPIRAPRVSAPAPRVAVPSAPAPRVAVPRVLAPAPRVAVPRVPALRGAPPAAPVTRVRVPGSAALAPWPVWLGLALVLGGAAGGGIRVRVRRNRLAAEAVPSRA